MVAAEADFLAQCAGIARRVLTDAGMPFTEDDVAEMAAEMQRDVEEFPPFTPEQRDQLAVLLRPAAHTA